MADDSQQVGQDEIEQLLRQAQGGAKPADPKPTSTPAVPSKSLGQDEIEALLNQGGGSAPPAKTASTPPTSSDPGAIQSLLNEVSATQGGAKAAIEPRKGGGDASTLAQGDLDYLLSQAEQALASINQPAQSAAVDTKPFRLVDFAGAPASSDSATLDLIRDVELDLRIELGRTHMYLEEVLKLSKGAVVSLDKLAGDPVDIFVNGRLIARGEVLILNDNFCVRVAELVAGDAAASA